MFGRPNLYTSYEAETEILPTYTQKGAMAVFIVILFLMPFSIPVVTESIPGLGWVPIIGDGIPFVRFLGDGDWLRPMSTVFVFVIAALGLNILAGVAGQVSLGHAFFMGVGAYFAAVLGGTETSAVWGWNLPMWIWLPGAGIGAAAVGVLIAPIAVRLRGLYLAIVTLGLVFIGIHMGNTNWGRNIAGDPGLGRDFPTLDIELWQESSPLVTVDDSGKWLWFDITDNQKAYIVLLVICLFMVWMAKNIVRTRTGRALQAIRDRDVAAEIMGVSEFKYKLIAFGISSFYAGVAGALFASLVGKLPAVQWNLFLSVEFVAIILIGGIGTVSGTILGTAFVLLGPQLIEEVTEWLADQSEAGGLMGGAAEVVLTRGPGDFGPVSVATQTPGWPLNVFDWNIALYGILIVVFLIFEPLGLYGIWARARNYWKRWPFSY